MIKEKLQSAWGWIKDKWKKFWKWILLGSVMTTLAITQLPQPIPAEFITAPENNAYKIGVMNYTADLEKNIMADRPLQYTLDDKFISFKPIEMRWDNSSFKTIQPKSAIINEKNYLYKDVFGTGIDIDMNFGERVFEKITKINSLADLGEIPKGVEFLEIVFEIESNFIIDGWNKNDKFEITDTVRLGDFSYIEPAMAWDSYREEICNNPEIPELCETLTNRIQIKNYLINKNGKLYLIKQIPIDWLKSAQYPIYTDVDVTYGTAQEFEDGSTVYISSAKLDTNKFVVCYQDSGDGNAGKCRVGSVSGTTISWGAISEFVGDVIYAGNVCSIGTDKFAVVYGDDALDDGYARAVTVSGETIGTWGTAKQFEVGDTEYPACHDINTDKIAIAYNDEGDSDTGKAIVCTLSGTTFTCGNALEFDQSIDYYSAWWIDVVKLDTDKFAVAFGSHEVDYQHTYAVVATADGTTITMGNEIEVGGTTYGLANIVSPDTDKFVVAYAASLGGNGKMRAGTVSGTTITLGTEIEFEDSGVALTSLSMTDIDSTHILVGYEDDGDDDKGKSNYTSIDFSDRSITTSTPDEFSGDAVAYLRDSVELIGTDKVVICYRDDADATNHGECIIGDTPAVEEGTNMQINIGDTWKDISEIQINIGDVWKDVSNIWINIGDAWKVIY